MKKFRSGRTNLDDQGRWDNPKNVNFEAVLQTIEANPVSSTQRVSGELSNVVHQLQDLKEHIQSSPNIAKLLTYHLGSSNCSLLRFLTILKINLSLIFIYWFTSSIFFWILQKPKWHFLVLGIWHIYLNSSSIAFLFDWVEFQSLYVPLLQASSSGFRHTWKSCTSQLLSMAINMI